MATVMKVSDFVDKLVDIAKNYKTLYVMGCFGAPMTAKNKTRYTNNYEYNSRASRAKLIKNASVDTFGFDCVNLIKGVLWGWSGDKNKVYGGATFKSNGVPDTSADGMIKLCTGLSTDFSKIEVGEAVWRTGHIGVYIGDGLAVECTPAWKNKVQITAVSNIGTKSGYNARKWTKHGKLPWIDYTVEKKEEAKTETKTETAEVKVEAALKKDTTLSGKYTVTPVAGLHIRVGAGTNKKSLGVLKKGTVVRNYGYYNVTSTGAKWLYVKASDGTLGYCSYSYLKKS